MLSLNTMVAENPNLKTGNSQAIMNKPKTKKERKCITQVHIASTEVTEIDFDLHEFVFGETNESPTIIDVDDVEREPGGVYPVDTYPIAIERLITELRQLQEKGANFVSVGYHDDHVGYELSGYQVRESSPEEIEKQEEAEKATVLIEKEIRQLRKDVELKINQLRETRRINK